MRRIAARGCGFLLVLFSLMCGAQTKPMPLDPARSPELGKLESSLHQPLREQYIWTTDTKDVSKSRYFRAGFSVAAIPQHATLYLSGPKRVQVFLNGAPIGDFQADPLAAISPAVYHVDVTRTLRPGKNVVAVKVQATTKSATWSPDRSYAQGSLLVKLIAAGYGVNRPPILISGSGWKCALEEQSGWESAAFDDAGWEPAALKGAVEGDIDLFQWNADAGLYRWPGYDGISPFLMHVPIPAVEIKEAAAGASRFENLGSLTSVSQGKPFTIDMPSVPANAHEAPSLVLDFGREVNGRLEALSGSLTPIRMTVAYGESIEEAIRKPYLGVDEIYVAPGETAYGPKSAFRYAKLQFFGAGPQLRFRTIRVDGIYYPVRYQGSFESSDPLLNRIWEVGAYTAHLCMQDDIWDAPKRDRGRWMGDLHVSGAVINDVFFDRFLMEDTLKRLNPAPVEAHVNGIPGYSAWWVIGLADYYRHTGALPFVEAAAPSLRGLLKYMEADLDERLLFANKHKKWPFVDWSPKMQQDSPETYMATQMEYYRAFVEGAYLLAEIGDRPTADYYTSLAERMKQAARQNYLDAGTGTFGMRWQTNSAAIFSGVAEAVDTDAIRNRLFATINTKAPQEADTPYYQAYVITAMARSGERQRALDWIRKYWGGMIQEGATSTWEGYNLDWPKDDFHAHLKADDGMGYFVSLAHGWSGGPTWWLMEQVLGIQPLKPGFKQVAIRPDLLDLEYVRGAQPTPNGLIKVEFRKSADALVELPAGVEALVSLPAAPGSVRVSINGTMQDGVSTENGTRVQVTLSKPGRYALRAD